MRANTSTRQKSAKPDTGARGSRRDQHKTLSRQLRRQLGARSRSPLPFDKLARELSGSISEKRHPAPIPCCVSASLRGLSASCNRGAPALHLALTLCLLALLSYIAWSDLRAFRIPDHATLPLALAGALWIWLTREPLALHIGAAIVVALVFLGLGLAYRQFRKIEGLGLGDVKLVAAGALWIGAGIAQAVAIGAGLALLVTVVKLRTARHSAGDPIPFGLYLAIGIGAVFLIR